MKLTVTGLGLGLIVLSTALAAVFYVRWFISLQPTQAMETSEVKPWQRDDIAQRWTLKQGDALMLKAEPNLLVGSGYSSPLVTITRSGERVDLIEVFPPPGVPVRVYRNEGEQVEHESR